MNNSTRFSLKKIIFIVALIFFLYLVGLKYISSHEYIHRSIFTKYGVYSETTMTYFLNGVTIPDKLDYERCTENCKKLQIVNDMVGYYFATFCMFIFVLYCFYFILNKK